MIRRIELVNFMSHPHTVIEPAQGLTVLTGGNNTGKSAVISALQTLCRNVSGDYMVRHGQRDCRIIVETGEGHVLEWKRVKGTVSYTVNGREVHRLRSAVPDDLHDLLRMPLVETEGDPFDVHFGEQKKPIFLLDESPARRATFFASSSDAIKLIEMQNRHRTRVREAKNEEGRLAQEAERLEKRLSTLAPLDEIENRIARVESEYDAIGQIEQQIAALAGHVDAMGRTRQHQQQYAETAESAAPLDEPPALADTALLEWLLRQMDWQQRRAASESETSEAVSRLSTPPEMEDTDRLDALIFRMQHAAAGLEKETGRQQVLSRCPDPPEAVDTSGLSRHIERMENAHKDIRARMADAEAAQMRLAEAENVLRQYIDAHNICPTCGQPMDADQVLNQFHEAGERAGK